jgi:hypothetical protein
MPKRIVDLRGSGGRPLLDIASYGRATPASGRAYTSAETAHALRTARGTPEVMVKVSGGARTLRGVAAHFDYIGREGRGDIETDDGQILHEKGIENALLKDWDLDLPTRRRAIIGDRKPLKRVHNLVFSMPEGTSPDKLLKAVRTFASKEFGLRHRYAMALHTDQRHPHVHVVVKAVSEDGERLNIRKATLRKWRQDFAQCLRDFGVEANATERAVRGAVTPRKLDGIHRAVRRGASTHMQHRAEVVAHELARRNFQIEPGKGALTSTRDAVLRGWAGLADALDISGRRSEAATIRQFTARMPPPVTEKEWIADQLRQSLRKSQNVKGPELGR